jgi:hypothetical protein
MKKSILIMAATAAASLSFGEGAIKQFNDLGYGTLSGRLQTLSMHRDYEGIGTQHSTTLGLQLGYLSPEKEGWSIGATYNGAGVLASKDYGNSTNPGEALIGNGRVNLLNEAYLAYSMEALGLTNTVATLGRKVNNGEVFRADDFRQKPRSIEAVSVESRDLHATRIQVGHAWEMSNWIDADPLWRFENFDNYGTDGITWGEVANTCVENLEVAAFDAFAYDIANLLGVRAKYQLSEDTALLGYYRNEVDVGSGADHNANVVGLSVVQNVGDFKLEGGYFGVIGDDLVFQETTVGINHALGSSMMLYAGQFQGDAHTFYGKAVTTLEKTKTTFYGLYNYTHHDTGKAGKLLRSGQELNVVVKQPVPKIDNLSVALKVGLGYKDGIGTTPATGDTFATDTRLFVTYTF